jgi:hypothetical protein
MLYTNSQWTDGKCGQCKCYSKIGRYGSRQHIANCSQRDIISVPDNLPKKVRVGTNLNYTSIYMYIARGNIVLTP